MNFDPQTIDVERGNYRPKSATIALCGPQVVDTMWALNALCLRVPINIRWKVTMYQHPDTAAARTAAEKDWRTSDDADYLVIWPAGQFVAWDLLLRGLDGPARVGNVAILKRGSGDRPIARDDLAADVANLGRPPPGPVPIIDASTRIEVCIPSLGRTSLSWATAMLQFGAPLGAIPHLSVVIGHEVGEARCKLVDRALSRDPRAPYLLFLGDDMLPPPNAVHRLFEILVTFPEIPAIGALYHNKVEPKQAVAWRGQRTIRPKLDYESGDLIEVDGQGLDFCLIRTAWLAEVSNPRFRTVQDGDACITEDVWFWSRARTETGKRGFVDTGLTVGHYDVRTGVVF